MVKNIGCMIIFDMLMVAAIATLMILKAEDAKKCDSNLYWAGVVLCLYNVFFVVRNTVICVIAYFSKNPASNNFLPRLCCIFIDCFVYSAIVIWATIKLMDDQATYCRDTDSDVEQFWWGILVLCIFGFCQMFVEWLTCLVSACVGCCMCLLYFTLAAEQRHRFSM